MSKLAVIPQISKYTFRHYVVKVVKESDTLALFLVHDLSSNPTADWVSQRMKY